MVVTTTRLHKVTVLEQLELVSVLARLQLLVMYSLFIMPRIVTIATVTLSLRLPCLLFANSRAAWNIAVTITDFIVFLIWVLL